MFVLWLYCRRKCNSVKVLAVCVAAVLFVVGIIGITVYFVLFAAKPGKYCNTTSMTARVRSLSLSLLCIFLGIWVLFFFDIPVWCVVGAAFCSKIQNVLQQNISPSVFTKIHEICGWHSTNTCQTLPKKWKSSKISHYMSNIPHNPPFEF